MDNYDLVNFNEGGELPDPDPEGDKPIPFDDSDPVSDQGQHPQEARQVSRKPLTLGSNQADPKQGTRPAAKPAAKPPGNPASSPAPASSGPVSQAARSGRIAHLKTFFTKLHPGALVFMDEQVTEWLQAHPDVTIKKTNVSVGEVQDKRTEPNLIINLWY